MTIGVIADTHSHLVPPKVLDDLRTFDVLIHAGDFCSIKDFEIFNSVGKLHAVYGNMDDADLVEKLPERLILKFGRFKIGVIHGHGSAQRSLEYVQEQFRKDQVDVVIFGHSHIPLQKIIDGVLYFNPGSPTDRILTPYRSYGILEMTDQNISAKIVKVD